MTLHHRLDVTTAVAEALTSWPGGPPNHVAVAILDGLKLHYLNLGAEGPRLLSECLDQLAEESTELAGRFRNARLD